MNPRASRTCSLELEASSIRGEQEEAAPIFFGPPFSLSDLARQTDSRWFRFWGLCKLLTFFTILFPNLEKQATTLEQLHFPPALQQTADRNMARCPTGPIQQGRLQRRDTQTAEGRYLHKPALTCSAAAVSSASLQINLWQNVSLRLCRCSVLIKHVDDFPLKFNMKTGR